MKRFALTVLAFLAVFVAANRDYLTGRAWPIWDADGFFAPFYVFVADLARAGQLLTWNPFNNAGSPDFADPQVGAFDPILLSFGLVTGGRVLGFLVYWLTMWSAAGIGILFLSRRLGCGMPLALVLALGFTFSGFFLGHAQHTSFVRSFAFLAPILWRLDVALVERRRRPPIEAGVLWGLSGLGGYPALLFLDLLVAGAWTIGRLSCLQQERESAGPEERSSWPGASALREGALSLALLVGTGALVLLPTFLGAIFEAGDYTSRSGGLPRETAVESNALHPRALSTFASPLLSTLPKEKLWDYTDRSSCGLYAGALAPMLALFALVARPRSVWRWCLLAAAALALCAAMGRALPLRGWLYDWVPPTRYFRHASVCAGYAIFFVVVLASAGARDLACAGRVSTSRKRTWSTAAVFASAAAGLAWLALERFDAVTALARATGAEAARSYLLWTWIGAPACILAAWLLRQHSRARLVPLAAMVGLAVADAFLCIDFSQPIMRNPPERVAALWAELEGNELRSFDLLQGRGTARGHVANSSAGLGPGIGSKNMLRRQAMYHAYTALTNPIHLELDGDPRTWGPLIEKERFYFSARVGKSAADRPGVLQTFTRHAKRLDLPPIVIEDDGEAPFEAMPIAELPSSIRVPTELREYTMRSLAFDVTVPADGWLLVTDRWARSWQARVNGAPAKIWKGNFIFRALELRAGPNSVEFAYRPFGFPWLIFLSWAVVAGVLAWSIASWFDGRTKGVQIPTAENAAVS